MDDIIGKIIAERYRVESFLGKGGMAEVYKVWDQKRSVYLALKILHADLAEDIVFLRRFQREAQTLSKLQHPNIVRFYGTEQDGDLVYMLMDYVEGTTLRKEILQAKGPLAMEWILEIMKSVCAALDYAHKSGFVHCDVKPANIMIHKNGAVYVSDFGIARMTEASTATMVGAGTPAYMAPEQARGETPVPQTDIYSLGVVLFEMLTGGERPFTGESAKTTGSTSEKVRWEQIRLPAPPPSKFNSSIAQSMDEIVLKCLEKSPVARYLSATDLLSDLTRQIAQANVPEQPKSEKAPVSAGAARTDSLNLSEQPKGDTAPQKQPVSQPKEVQKANPLPRRKMGLAFVSLIGGGIVILVFFLIFGKSMLSQPGLPVPTATSVSSTSTFTPALPVTNAPSLTNIPAPTLPPTLPSTLGIGSTQISPNDGAVMVFVPTGEFKMGSKSRDDEQPIQPISLNDFWIDQTEVTNKQFAACVSVGVCDPHDNISITRLGYFDSPEFADYPVIKVSWYDARTYCEWAGRRLPTEAEWEKAARGIDQRTYPWGNNAPKKDLLNHNNFLGDTTEVKKYPSGVSYYQVYDMAGNVWEWVASLYKPYPYDPLDGREDLTSIFTRVLRGGSWSSDDNRVRSASRKNVEPKLADFDIGFRCALSIP